MGRDLDLTDRPPPGAVAVVPERACILEMQEWWVQIRSLGAGRLSRGSRREAVFLLSRQSARVP